MRLTRYLLIPGLALAFMVSSNRAQDDALFDALFDDLDALLSSQPEPAPAVEPEPVAAFEDDLDDLLTPAVADPEPMVEVPAVEDDLWDSALEDAWTETVEPAEEFFETPDLTQELEAPESDFADWADVDVETVDGVEEAADLVEAVEEFVEDAWIVDVPEEVVPVADAVEVAEPADVWADVFGFDDDLEPAPAEVVDLVPAADFDADWDDVEVAGLDEEAEDLFEVAEVTDELRVEASRTARNEEIRRQALETEGRQKYNQGKAALDQGRYEDAARLLDEARAALAVRPGNEALIEDARISAANAYYQIARQNLSSDPARARTAIDQSLRRAPESRRAQSFEKRVQAAEQRAARIAALPTPPDLQPRFRDKRDTVNSLLAEGRALFELGEFNEAEVVFDRILSIDEYNVDAMRFLRRLEEIRYERRSLEREATVMAAMQQVRDTWNPRNRGEISRPSALVGDGPVPVDTPTQRLQSKMESIIIPSISFRQANITDVVNFLVEASIAGDPQGDGVNIILNLQTAPAAAAPAPRAAPAADPFGFGGFDDFGFDEPAAGFAAPGASDIPAITLNLRRVSLHEAIKYITEVADLKFRLEDNVVIINRADAVIGRVITRMYPVQPSILDVIVEREDTRGGGGGDFVEFGTRTTISRGDVRDFFERAGVPFPPGTSITYNQSISQLIVANTAENLENFERILSRLNVVPNQVEIEARFVEISQTDLEELGLQWMLTDNWQLATRGSGGPGTREAIQVNADPQGMTKGLRFFGSDRATGAINPLSAATAGVGQSPLGNILSFASVLTNPELQVVVQALSQRGNSDLLSAPRITTRSGVNAQIQVVTEIIYPTEFDVTEPTIASSTTIVSDGTAAGGGLVTPPTVTPGVFETRSIGVILNVTPTVGPDGYTIDLTLAPEVAELVDWIQYGSTVSAGGQTFTYNIPMPVFASRNVTTSIVVWDGQTVVMGGLIREDLVTFRDKVPILGDIPILGRLFRSEGEYSQKKNLLIFVTARLVDPAGRPIHRGDQLGLDGGPES
ncbi:MAG TPA: hypothetical protein PKE55_02445 [Kiritimatiellia bacterium]|nr:hypothetical protein [Kiritimatiellia bacterium]